MGATTTPAHISFLERMYSDLYIASIILLCIGLSVLVAVLVDTIFGVAKAKAAGREISSHKFGRFAYKVIRYLALLLIVFLFDLILIVPGFTAVPFLAATMGLALVGLEIASCKEKLETKERARLEASMKVASSVVEKIAAKGASLYKVFVEEEDKTNPNASQTSAS